MMMTRKTRFGLAAASIVAGIAAFLLLTTSSTFTTPLATVKGAAPVYVGPNGASEAPTYAFGKPIPNSALVTYTLHIDSSRPYVSVPDLIAVSVASGNSVSVSVPSGVLVRSVVPMATDVVTYPSANATTDTTTFSRESDRILVHAGQSGEWALIAQAPGKYPVVVRVGTHTATIPLTAVSAPNAPLTTRTSYSSLLVGSSLSVPLGQSAPAGAHVVWSMTADLNGRHITMAKSDVTTTGYLTRLPMRGAVYGTVTQTMTEVGVPSSLMVEGYTPMWDQPSEFATVTPLEVVDPLHHNILWLVLGGALAVLVLALPGRRNRDGGDEGDGQDGRIA